ncbi:MAG: tRNA uracil 4-sulfurtransferase ThiI [Oribacterium sp.]
MLYHSFLIKYAEIGTKGRNRYVFEDALVHDIRMKLRKAEGEFSVTRERGRIYVNVKSERYDYDNVVDALRHVFGIIGICPMVQLAGTHDISVLSEQVISYWRQVYGDRIVSFKVETRRADKGFPMQSGEIDAELGHQILSHFPNTSVDVHHPELRLHVEIRQFINLYSEILPGAGGMPLGTNGKAMLLLSGGIDSPVAGYLIGKRGALIEATYFHAPPYTSERAKQKVIDLAKQVSKYTGPIALHVVNFTDIQIAIYDKCPHEELTILMRRYMMRIAERIARDRGCIGLITGESIGQVASQTMQSLVCTNEVCTLPVYRPVIAFDKQEIIDLSQRIGTYETSIEPYEDCCTIFVARHPVTKPIPEKMRKSEQNLLPEISEMVDKAVENAELIWCDPFR